MEKSHEIAQEVAGKMPRASELTYALVNQAAGCTLTFRIPGYVTVLLGRALEWHSRGQRFDPAYLHHHRECEENLTSLEVGFLLYAAIAEMSSPALNCSKSMLKSICSR